MNLSVLLHVDNRLRIVLSNEVHNRCPLCPLNRDRLRSQLLSILFPPFKTEDDYVDARGNFGATMISSTV